SFWRRPGAASRLSWSVSLGRELPGPRAIGRAIDELEGRGDVLATPHLIAELHRVALLDLGAERHVCWDGHGRAVVQQHLIPPYTHDAALDHPLPLHTGRLRERRQARPGPTRRDQHRYDHQYSLHCDCLPRRRVSLP